MWTLSCGHSGIGHDNTVAEFDLAPRAGRDLAVVGDHHECHLPLQVDLLQQVQHGPAGGLVGASRIGAALGCLPLVGFDMGGTSTDVSWSEGASGGATWQRREQAELHGLPLQAAMLDIHTVAAGGGSLIRFDGLRLQVGPASAGADPGPACYGRGGPLSVTDANLLLGRLQPAHVPAVFWSFANSWQDVFRNGVADHAIK